MDDFYREFSMSKFATKEDRYEAIIQALSVALAEKDEALNSFLFEFGDKAESATVQKGRKAIALQPHAALVAKIKADAREEFAAAFDETWRDDHATRFLRGDYADRIERGEVE